jgi:putative tryptophan/tyrosine transport system substrate-binding protein
MQARAQIPRVGILIPETGRAENQANKGLIDELARAGYRNRKNILFEIRNAKRDRGMLQSLAVDLVKQNVQVILTSGASATRAAATATQDIPIVFIYAGDPALAGFARGASAAQTNVAGVAAFARESLDIRLAFLKEIVPSLQAVRIFYDWNNVSSRENFAQAENQVNKIGLRALGHPIKSIEELNATIRGLESNRGDAIFQISDDLVDSAGEEIFDLARQKKIPTMFNEEAWAIKGALAAYGPNYLELGRQAGRLVDEILKGRPPASLPMQRAAKFDLILNYRTATFIGIHLNQQLLKKADKVIR